ncbi:MAG: S41 family peptidase [Melioribacteraceae bacterium]|nr:S41 family peptidase [Melioribacteraceae bacterium]
MKVISKILPIIISIVVLSCSESENVSPFFSMRWEGDNFQVKVDQTDNEWFTLLEANNIPFGKICNELKSKSYSWRYEITEEYVKAMRKFGLEIENEVSVKLKNTSGNLIDKKLKLTRDNWKNNILEVHNYSVKDVSFFSIDNKYNFLKSEPLKDVSAVTIPKRTLSPTISKKEAIDYLNRLQGIIENNFSYATKFDGNYLEALAAIKSSLNETIYLADLESKIIKFIALFGDGHAGYLFSSARYNRSYLPFLIKKTKEGFIALSDERNSFLEKDFPVINKIDGIDIAKWIEASKLYTAKGSKQYVSSTTVRKLREINQLRLELNLPLNKQVSVELSSFDNAKIKTILLDLTDTKPIYGPGYDNESKILESNIGYLRIKKMEKISDNIIELMNDFRNTEGLIIDVRGNGGGNRKIIVDLLPYFLEENEFYLSNLAKYRIQPLDEKNLTEGYLEDRFLYPISSQRFNKDEKQILQEFIKKFNPLWIAPDSNFSNWHFMVHRKSDNPLSYHYTKKVVVLMDSDCFSATDVLLNSLKGRKNIVLIGTPSGGGSGRSYIYFFPGEPINILRLSTMISYKTNGELIEGNGIDPDIYLEESITDFMGQTDSMLDQAINVLKNK